MFCPSCGTQTDPNIKFCKRCGLALNQIRNVMTPNSPNNNSANWQGWIKDEWAKHKKSPEQKRLEEIKGGIITTAVGISATIFLYFLMSAVARNEPRDAEILRSVWLAGLVPTVIGLAIMFNGMFISPKIVALKRREEMQEAADANWANPIQSDALEAAPSAQALPAANFDYSVTEHTTAKLKEKIPVPASRDTQ